MRIPFHRILDAANKAREVSLGFGVSESLGILEQVAWEAPAYEHRVVEEWSRAGGSPDGPPLHTYRESEFGDLVRRAEQIVGGKIEVEFGAGEIVIDRPRERKVRPHVQEVA